MGVYIKGIEMPKICDDCFLPLQYCPYAMKPNGECPLVEIPPHGRLIDADALYTRMEKAHTDWREHPERYNDVIPVNADEIFVLTEAVVIPADKESGE